jgi:hypothetical protein
VGESVAAVEIGRDWFRVFLFMSKKY